MKISGRYTVTDHVAEGACGVVMTVDAPVMKRSVTLITVAPDAPPEASARLERAALEEGGCGKGALHVNDCGELPDGRTYVIATLEPLQIAELLTGMRVLGRPR